MEIPRKYIEEISKTICWPDPDDFCGGDEEENAEAIQSIIDVYVAAVKERDKEWSQIVIKAIQFNMDMIK